MCTICWRHHPRLRYGICTQMLAHLLFAVERAATKGKTKTKQRIAVQTRVRELLKQFNQLVFDICRHLQVRPLPTRSSGDSAPRRSLKPGGVRQSIRSGLKATDTSADVDALSLAVLAMLGCLAELRPIWFTSQWGLYLSESVDLAGYLVNTFGAGHRAFPLGIDRSRYVALPMVFKLWQESGFEVWDMDNNVMLSQSERPIRLESAILSRLLPANPSIVRQAAARCLLRIVQATDLNNWFAVIPTR